MEDKTVTEQAILEFKPLTSERRVVDFALPTHLTLGGQLVSLPYSILQKDPHFLLNEEGKPVRAAWISPALAHILNGLRFDSSDIKIAELRRAITAVEDKIASIIKFGILKNKQGPGAMSFCQSNSNVPKDSIVISARTFDTLCKASSKWKTTKNVMVVRFPNLGPGTTQKLKLIVNKPQGLDLLSAPLPSNSIGFRIDNLSQLLSAIEKDDYADEVDTSGLLDCFYLNPEVLKGGLQGDGDGDQVFIVCEDRGSPIFQEINLVREPGDISTDLVDTLINKANRVKTNDLKTWLPNYFDDVPIGPATYAVRWMLFNELPRHKDSKHPMHDAWKVVGPIGIDWMEFIFDIRKGGWTDEQIQKHMDKLMNIVKEIQKAKENGNWFAKVVTSSTVEDVSGFIRTFPTLQSFVDYVTGQPSVEKKQNNPFRIE